jgi:polar amino acid transport system substrate-binding protein
MTPLRLIVALALCLSFAVPLHAQPEPLRVVIKPLPPFVMEQSGAWIGFSIDLLALVAARAGFTYTLTSVETVGEQIDAVEQGDADLAIAGISITAQREARIDFSQPMFDAGLGILTTTETGLTLVDMLRSFLSPALLQVIAIMIGTIIIAAHLVWLIERGRNPDFPKTYFAGIWEGIWWAAVTIATVGYGDKTPRSFVGRLAAIFWIFAGIILIANFTATTTAAFTVQELRGTVNGLNDLPGKRVATVDGTTAAAFLTQVRIPYRAAATIDEAYTLMDDGEIDAIVYDAPVLLYYAAGEGQGRVRLAGEVFRREDYGIALPSGSPYREAVNRALIEVRESGEYDALYRAWFGEE